MLREGPSTHSMAFWPFGRKKRKTDLSDEKVIAPSQTRTDNAVSHPPQTGTVTTEIHASATKLRRKSNRREGSWRLRNDSAASIKSGKGQGLKAQEKIQTATVPPVPTLPRSMIGDFNPLDENTILQRESATSRQPLAEVPTNREDIPSYYFQNTVSLTSIQPENFSILAEIPTLRSSRGGGESSILRRKSSKRKADDVAREKEIRAMSSPIPIPKRPQSHQSGLLARESRAMPGRLNRNLSRPTSEISIPHADSIQSSKSAASEMHSFKISAFDALSPRPTIKYAGNPRITGGSNLGMSRASTRKDHRPSIPEEKLNSRERIDDLADELDASTLKELMLRDQRRRDRKRTSDHEKVHRRLQKKAGKQVAEEATRQPVSDESVKEKGGGSSLDVAAATSQGPADHPLNGPNRAAAESADSWREGLSKEEELSPEDPYLDSMAEPHFEDGTPDERDEPVIGTAKAVRLSTASMSPPTSPSPAHVRGPSNLSIVSDMASRSTPDIPMPVQPDQSRRDSDSETRLGSSWTSFFRRPPTRDRRTTPDGGRATPSEFSNTSRESFARQLVPPAFVKNTRIRSGTPARMNSKFKEDLPELPVSPPDSRVQSLELRADSPYIDQVSKVSLISAGKAPADQPLSDVHPAYREEVATVSRHQSFRTTSPGGPSATILSQSLASVDSEGSWLSGGRPSKRSSQQVNPLRGSAGSLSQPLHEPRNSEEEHGDAGSSYSRRKPNATPFRGPAGLVSQLRKPPRTVSAAESDEEESMQPTRAVSPDEELKVDTVVGRHPTIVCRGPRAKSTEGLLDDFQAGEDSLESSPSSPYGDSSIPQSERVQSLKDNGSSLERATSVDLGKQGHIRHISAGSAKLLDLPARASGEHKRLSTSSAEKGHLRADGKTSDTLSSKL